MFARAYKLAKEFTKPVITSILFFDKTVESGCGAFVILNEEGWMITVAHLWEPYLVFQQHEKELVDYNLKRQSIEQDRTLDDEQKMQRIRALRADPKWITKLSFWWGGDDVELKDIKLFPEGDLLTGRLEPFDPKSIRVYPSLKDPTRNLDPGTSLCRLGYPFHQIKAAFDESGGEFKLAPDSLTLFPIEGIYTRNIITGKSRDGKYVIKFLETSSPGLRGQSGGPIFDVKGTIWALQSSTTHFQLGFSPKVVRDGKEIEEHQFLNAGWGVHPELLVAFLRDNAVKFSLSDY